VAFLDAFGPAHRALLESTAHTMRLTKGQHLLRRGEPGGDVFVLREGTLEAVDPRATPELILSTLPAGAVVGEMAFVDNSPRSVDVRAGTDAVVLRWTRDELHRLLVSHPDLASAFYENVARLATSRVRSLTEGAVSGAYGRDTPHVADADEVRAWVDRIAERVKLALPPVETVLRRDPEDPAAVARVGEVLDEVQVEVDLLFEATTDPVSRRFAAELLGRELHPYLVRSALAERSIRRPEGVAGTPDILAHVLVGTAGGDGRLGELIDRWLLDRPTFRALRSLRGPLVELVVGALPRDRERKVLLVTVGTGSIPAGLCAALDLPTTLTMLDQSADALALVEAPDRASPVRVVALQESLTRFASGRATLGIPRQDVIVLHGLVEYLPEPMVVSLLSTCRALLADGGAVALATLAPSPDRTLVDRLLTWPTLRRADDALDGLMDAARLRIVSRPAVEDPARLLLLRAVAAAAARG
jgi:extracellular factor (EF) 3-hydroxypalmitic acid methyl ester biosynthesis protein